MSLANEKQLQIDEYINVQFLKSNVDKILAFIMYLEKIGIDTITTEHIIECFKLIGEEPISNISQTLRDLQSSKYERICFINGYESTLKGREHCSKKNLLK